MESTNNNNNQLSQYDFKELWIELSTMKKRIDQLEKSHEKQQERLDILERENHALKKKKELNNPNGIKEGGLVLKRKRTENGEDRVHEKKTESVSTSVSAGKKKTKTNNSNNNDNEAVVISQYDNGDSFDSLSDDLLHKIVEFDGNCYTKFGSINKRCKNIYDVKEYKLKKETCLYGYGTVDMMLERYLQKRREGMLNDDEKIRITETLILYNRLDAIDWIIQLGDSELLVELCCTAAFYGKVNILTNVFIKSNLTMLEHILNNELLCDQAAMNLKLETLKWLRKYGAKLVTDTFTLTRFNLHEEMVQYLRLEGCPEPTEDRDDDEDGDF